MEFEYISNKVELQNTKQLYTLTEIDQALGVIAKQLNQRFADEAITLIPVLNGGLMTAAHLLLKLQFNVYVDSIYATRYRDQTQGYSLEWKQYPNRDLRNQTVVLVDDIYDEGVTLSEVKAYCLAQGAKAVVAVVLLNKQHSRKISSMIPDYIAFTIPDVYAFGFGLDYHGLYRNLPGIYIFT